MFDLGTETQASNSVPFVAHTCLITSQFPACRGICALRSGWSLAHPGAPPSPQEETLGPAASLSDMLKELP